MEQSIGRPCRLYFPNWSRSRSRYSFVYSFPSQKNSITSPTGFYSLITVFQPLWLSFCTSSKSSSFPLEEFILIISFVLISLLLSLHGWLLVISVSAQTSGPWWRLPWPPNHSLFNLTNMLYLLCARQCSRCWGCRGEQRKTPAFSVLMTHSGTSKQCNQR